MKHKVYIILRQTAPRFTICPNREIFFEKLYQDLFGVARLFHHIINISIGWIVRGWQYKHNYIDTYLYTCVLTFAQPHKK